MSRGVQTPLHVCGNAANLEYRTKEIFASVKKSCSALQIGCIPTDVQGSIILSSEYLLMHTKRGWPRSAIVVFQSLFQSVQSYNHSFSTISHSQCTCFSIESYSSKGSFCTTCVFWLCGQNIHSGATIYLNTNNRKLQAWRDVIFVILFTNVIIHVLVLTLISFVENLISNLIKKYVSQSPNY